MNYSTWIYITFFALYPVCAGHVRHSLARLFLAKLIRHLTHTVHQLITLQLEVQHGCMPSSAWECLRNFCWMIPAMLSGYPPSFPSLGGWCLYLLSGGGTSCPDCASRVQLESQDHVSGGPHGPPTTVLLYVHVPLWHRMVPLVLCGQTNYRKLLFICLVKKIFA